MQGNPKSESPRKRLTTMLGSLTLFCACVAGVGPAAAQTAHIHVSPSGSDRADGTREAPFRTVFRAQQAAREAAAAATGDVAVSLAPGVYRLDRTLEFTEADSGRDGHHVVYCGEAGLGSARLLGSTLLKGWEECGNGVWTVRLREGMLFHTLYENGARAHKARFPNYTFQPEFPTARGPYLVSEDGSPTSEEGERTGWLVYRPEDAPPVTAITKMKVLLYSEGKCDWMRTVRAVNAIEPDACRLTIAGHFWRGVKAQARFFFEDELGFLDAPGEFFIDERSHTLYYMPMGEGHPDTLGIAAPVLTRLIQVKGTSRKDCVENLRLEGLAFEETDGLPKGWWSTRYGLTDGALVWMNNTAGVEVRECHLKNSGRSGVMIVGHNVASRVTGCWIEHMGLNGVTLSNRWRDKNDETTLLDRCEGNRVHNCRIHGVGEIHTYAACVNLFNVAHNDVSHCELYDSVRYAVTVRGDTGQQHGPPVSTNQPRCTGNRVHHIRAYRCGQDGGDMGTLHCAGLNNPGGGCVNTFEQITVADSRAVPSMRDIAPDGIFLDWPKMSMDQVFRNVHIIRCQGQQIRSNRPDNAESAQTVNVSWQPGFDTALMDYENIGLTASFPAAYAENRARGLPPSAPRELQLEAASHDSVVLRWTVPEHRFRGSPQYTVFRDGRSVGLTQDTTFTDTRLTERTQYRYAVAAQDGDLCHLGPRSAPCELRTPPDLVPPVVEHVWFTRRPDTADSATPRAAAEPGSRGTDSRGTPGVQRVNGSGTDTLVRVLFSKPMARATVARTDNYQFTPPLDVTGVRRVTADCIELRVTGFTPGDTVALSIHGVTDSAGAANALSDATNLPVTVDGKGAAYDMRLTDEGRLFDSLGSGGDAHLHGDATVQAQADPFGGPALVLDGDGDYALASPGINLGAGDFTLMAWVWMEEPGRIILAKGNGFGSLAEWSFGWQGPRLRDSVSLRLNNVFHSTAASAVPVRKWVHVAFVRRGPQGVPYADGEPSGEPHDLSAVGDLSNDKPLRIGRRAHEPNPAYFKGKVGDVKILPYALSPEQVRMEASTATE